MTNESLIKAKALELVAPYLRMNELNLHGSNFLPVSKENLEIIITTAVRAGVTLAESQQ